MMKYLKNFLILLVFVFSFSLCEAVPGQYWSLKSKEFLRENPSFAPKTNLSPSDFLTLFKDGPQHEKEELKKIHQTHANLVTGGAILQWAFIFLFGWIFTVANK